MKNIGQQNEDGTRETDNLRAGETGIDSCRHVGGENENERLEQFLTANLTRNESSFQIPHEQLFQDALTTLNKILFRDSETPSNLDGDQWFGVIEMKLFTHAHRGFPIFEGPHGNKFPSTVHPADLFSTVGVFALSLLIHKNRSLRGLSRSMVHFIVYKDFSYESNFIWAKDDLSKHAQAKINICETYLTGSILSWKDKATLQKLLLCHKLSTSLDTDTAVKQLKNQIAYMDIIFRRIPALRAIKKCFEESGVSKFLRNNERCIEFAFPSD